MTDDVAQVFVPPSREARFLARHLGWLLAPADGRGTLPSRIVGFVIIAPFTQLTFLSYDLQAFLFEVFHTTRVARVGHFVFMAAVNLFVMAGLVPVAGGEPWALGTGATAWATLLLIWYAAVAASARLVAWWLVMIPVVAVLWCLAHAFAALVVDPDSWWTSPWVWMGVSASLIALSHAPEPRLPPRATFGKRWMGHAEFVRGGRSGPLSIVARSAAVGMQAFSGTLNELWASPRLLPYNVLMLMFRFGYRPARRAELAAWVRRANEAGQPALDYVGTGGGTFLSETGTLSDD